MDPIRVCFVCLGNICRSPTAEGVFKHLVERAGLSARFRIRSAGTGSWHVGDPPDPRTQTAAERRGIRLNGRARHFTLAELDDSDYVLAMDQKNLTALQGLATHVHHRQKIFLLRDFDPAVPLLRAVLAPDGHRVAYDTPDGVVVWDLHPDLLRAAACRVAGRDLTGAEWAQYVGTLSPQFDLCPN